MQRDKSIAYNLREILKDKRAISAWAQDILFDLADILDDSQLEEEETMYLHVVRDEEFITGETSSLFKNSLRCITIGPKGRVETPLSTTYIETPTAAQCIREIHQCVYALACVSSGLAEKLTITYPESDIVDFVNKDTELPEGLYWEGATKARDDLFELTKTLPIPKGIDLIYRSSYLGDP